MKSYPILLLLFLLTSMIHFSCSENSSAPFESSSSLEASAIPDTNLPTERILVKTAEISMDVKNVEKSVLTFQSLVNDLDGHVFHYEIQNEIQNQNEIQQTMDSNRVTSEIYPTGLMKVKIPITNGDTFISAVLQSDGHISNFMLDENDVTEEIIEKSELMKSDQGIIAENKVGPSKSKKENHVDAVYMAKDLNESFIKRKADFSSNSYRTKYLWFDIKLNGTKFTSSTMAAFSKPLHEPFYISAFESLRAGWYGFSVFINLILRLWPFLLIGFICWLVWKKREVLFKFNLP